jgi:hypothetical protein
MEIPPLREGNCYGLLKVTRVYPHVNRSGRRGRPPQPRCDVLCVCGKALKGIKAATLLSGRRRTCGAPVGNRTLFTGLRLESPYTGAWGEILGYVGSRWERTCRDNRPCMRLYAYYAVRVGGGGDAPVEGILSDLQVRAWVYLVFPPAQFYGAALTIPPPDLHWDPATARECQGQPRPRVAGVKGGRRPRLSLQGRVFGQWKVLKDPYVDRDGQVHWDKALCRCVCLTTRAVLRKALKAGLSCSCGCVNTRLALQPGTAYGKTFLVGEGGVLESSGTAVPLAQRWTAQAQGFRTGLMVHRRLPEKP